METEQKPSVKPVALIILDGWGYQKETAGNAIALAKKPFYDSLLNTYPNTTLEAAGRAVGLPIDAFGNSEVGHLTIGCGRIVDSHPVRINTSINDGSFFSNKAILDAIRHAQATKGCLHLMGLFSDKSVHSDIRHLYSLLLLCHQQRFYDVVVHAFLDGRDTAPAAALEYLTAAAQKMNSTGVGQFGVIVGRYFAMDRDNRWDRTKKAYDALTDHTGQAVHSFEELSDQIHYHYSNGETDEFIEPMVFEDSPPILNGDSVIFFNFREDRARQLTHAFIDQTFNGFERKKLDRLYFCTFTRYDDRLPNPVAFDTPLIVNTLGEVYSALDLSQLRVAETEKYAHVTYFFNGLRKQPYPKEERILIDSPKIATYDLQPEMSAVKITDAAIDALDKKYYDLLVLNYANADMVGHTGNIAAATAAVEVIDTCLSRLVPYLLDSGRIVIITADHGNAENMIGDSAKSHDMSPVPVIFCYSSAKGQPLDKGGLCDVAPTLLTLAGLDVPAEMTGTVLLNNPL